MCTGVNDAPGETHRELAAAGQWQLDGAQPQRGVCHQPGTSGTCGTPAGLAFSCGRANSSR